MSPKAGEIWKVVAGASGPVEVLASQRNGARLTVRPVAPHFAYTNPIPASAFLERLAVVECPECSEMFLFDDDFLCPSCRGEG